MKKVKVVGLALLATTAGAVVLIVPQSCGARTPNTVKMKIGESIVVTPIPVSNLADELPKAPPKKLLIKFMNGGKEVSTKSGAVIRFYGSFDSKEPYYTLRAEDFTAMHLRSGCASSDVSLLDNAIESDVLICDGSLDVLRANKIEIEMPDGKKKTATSVVPESVESDLFVGDVMFM